jgi:diguanylate cyclase (GGDEF)-like protein
MLQARQDASRGVENQVFWSYRLNWAAMKALVIEDTATSLALVCHLLDRMGITPLPVRDGLNGIAVFEQEQPDLILLDIVLPGIDGIEVARRIRALEKPGEWTPIIFLTGRTRDEDLEQGIGAGGDDYLFKPVSEVVLSAKVRAMQRIVQMRDSLVVLTRKLDEANRELTRLSAIDGLTGIPNRRQFDEALQREWRRGMRGRLPLSLVLVDVDFFKQFNDTYGHQAGDDCLIAVARQLGSQLKRPADVVARYGGEEFAAVLPETGREGALLVAESMRAAVKALGIPHASSTASNMVTISIGVATLAPQLPDGAPGMLAAADRALYEAKRQGRNRICEADPALPVALPAS